jgi:hypothetical protein
MSQPEVAEKQSTTLAVFDRMKAEIVSGGQLNKHMLRAAFGPDITDRRFGMSFHHARMQLEDEGYFLKPVRGKSGVYAIATADDVADKALNKSRLRVVKAVDRRQDILRNAQKHAGLDEESRQRLNAEEVVYSRFQQVAHRALLKRERKMPEGLE